MITSGKSLLGYYLVRVRKNQLKPLVAIDFYCAVHKILNMSEDPAMIRLYWDGLLNQYSTHDIVVLSDKKPYWRTQVYPEYKGNRPKYKDDNFALVESIGRSIVPNMLELEGLEADDWAGVLVMYHCQQETRPELELRTVDTDWLQLVSDTVVWSNYGRHLPQYRGTAEAINWTYEKLGVLITEAKDIAKVKYQLGDKVDNIPPKHSTDLVSLQGETWLNGLKDAGFNISDLQQEVAKYYDI